MQEQGGVIWIPSEVKRNPAARVAEIRQMVLREAAVCCSMSHPTVVATYHFEVLQADAFYNAPSGLTIDEGQCGSGAFKLYLIQVPKIR